MALVVSSLLTAVYHETVAGVEALMAGAAGWALLHGMGITGTHAATDLSHFSSTHHSRMALNKMHSFAVFCHLII